MFYKGPCPIKYDGNILMAINGLYNGRYYSRSILGTANYGGVYYVNGDPATGLYNGTYYSNGTPGTGTSGGLYYINGSLFTGYNNSNYYNNGVVITSDGSQTWKLSSNLSFIKGAPGILLDDGRLLFAGGKDKFANTPTDQWEVHDPAYNFSVVEFGLTDGSGQTAPMPGVVYDNTLIKLTNGKVVSVGGKTVTNDVYNRRQETFILDPSKIGTSQACWSVSLSLPSTEVGINSLIQLIPGTNKIIVTGGVYNTSPFITTHTNKGYILDYDANTVTQISNMSITRSQHTGVVLPNGNYFIWGGASTGDSGNAYSYNFNTNTWTFLKNSGLNTTLNKADSYVINNTDVYFVAPETAVTSYVKKYNIANNTFTNISNILDAGENYPDSRIESILLNDNRILIYGSNTASGDNGLIGIFDPSNSAFDNLSVNNLVNCGSSYVGAPNLIMLSNNKIVAHNGDRYSVMDF